MYTFEISDIMFFINCLKIQPQALTSILMYLSPSHSSYTITYPLPIATESIIFILIEFVDFGTPCQSSISRHTIVCRAAQ